MAKTIAFLLCCVVVCSTVAAARPAWHQVTSSYTYSDYLKDFDKSAPTDGQELAKRSAAFAESLKFVIQHNAKEGATWKAGLNDFSDWTHEEWSAVQGGHPASDERSSVGSTPSTTDDQPSSVDWRLYNPRVLTAIKNQGGCGSCWAHSATEGIETYFSLQTKGQLPVLSQQQITSCSKKGGCKGGSTVHGWKYVGKFGGLYNDWQYGYTDFFSHAEGGGTSKCRNLTEIAPHVKPRVNVTGHTVLTPNNNATVVKAQLAGVGPTSIYVAAVPWRHYESGVFQNIAGSKDEWKIDHAVQMVGYGVTNSTTDGTEMGYWIVRNSWGSRWGEDGFIRLWRALPSMNQTEPCGLSPRLEYLCGTSACLHFQGYPHVALV